MNLLKAINESDKINNKAPKLINEYPNDDFFRLTATMPMKLITIQ